MSVDKIKAPIQHISSKFLANTTDGRYYSVTFSNPTPTRSVALVVCGSQTVPSSHIEYLVVSPGVSGTQTFDCGISAWCGVLVLYDSDFLVIS